MLGRTLEQIRDRQDGFVRRYHLRAEGADPGLFTPAGPRLRNHLALRLGLDGEGLCCEAVLSLSRALAAHPGFEELLTEWSCRFLEEALEEHELRGELSGWLARPETLERGGVVLERSLCEGSLQLSVRRASKPPLWKRGWLKR